MQTPLEFRLLVSGIPFPPLDAEDDRLKVILGEALPGDKVTEEFFIDPSG